MRIQVCLSELNFHNLVEEDNAKKNDNIKNYYNLKKIKLTIEFLVNKTVVPSLVSNSPKSLTARTSNKKFIYLKKKKTNMD